MGRADPALSVWLLAKGPKVRRNLLLALIALLPLVFLWNTTNDAFSLPKLALLTVFIALIGGLRLIELALGRSFPAMRWMAAPLLLLTLPLAASWVFTSYRSWSLIGQYGRYEGLIPYLLVAALGVLIADAFPGSKADLAWAFVAGATATALYGLIQALGLDPLDVPTVDRSVASSIGHPNFLGGYLAVALPVSVSLWVMGGRHRLPAMAATVAMTLTLLVTFSQGPWGGALAGTALLIALLAGGKRFRLRVTALGVVVAVPIVMVGTIVFTQLGDTAPTSLGTARARGYWWRSAISMSEDRPIFGHGPNVYAFKNVPYRLPQDALAHEDALTNNPHSVPLGFLANAGSLGFLAWLGIVTWALLRIPAAGRASPLGAGFAAATVAYVVQSLVNIDQISLRSIFWVCLGVLASLSPPAADKQTSKPSANVRLRGFRVAAAITAAVVAVSWAVAWTVRAVSADLLAFRASRTEDAPEALELYERAFGYRDTVQYRTMYGERLGRAAVDQGIVRADLIGRMHRVFSITRDLPDMFALNAYADSLHAWSAIDLSAGPPAVHLSGRVVDIDPHSPVPRMRLAEGYLHLSAPRRAISTLSHLLDLYDRFPNLNGREPDTRATIALALLDIGQREQAQDELNAALAILARSREDRSVCAVEVAEAAIAAGQGLEVTLFDETDLRLRLLCSLPMQRFAERLVEEVSTIRASG